MNRRSPLTDIEVEIVVETDKAVRVHDGRAFAWLPKIQIEIERKKGTPLATVTLSERLAIEKGLV